MRLDVQRRVGQATLTVAALQLVLRFAGEAATYVAASIAQAAFRAHRIQLAAMLQEAAGIPLDDDEMEAGIQFLRDVTDELGDMEGGDE